MTRSMLIFAGSAVLISVSSSAAVPDYASQNAALKIIYEAEDRTCGQFPLFEGRSAKLSPHAEATISAAVKSILNIGFGTGVKKDDKSYENIVREQLAGLYAKDQDCRTVVFAGLIFLVQKIDPATTITAVEVPPVAQFSVWGTVLQSDREGTRVLLPRTAEDIYKCSDEPAQIGIICLKSNNYENQKYPFPPDPGYHWDTTRIEFHELAGFGRAGGIGYTIENGIIVVGAWVRSDPPNKAKASLAAYEVRNGPTPDFIQITEGKLAPSSDHPVMLPEGISDWQIQIDFPATERKPARRKVVASEFPDSLMPYLQIKLLANGRQLMLTTTDRAPN